MDLKHATSEAAFEAKYRHSRDPWNFASSPYERRRYAATLQSLARPRYSRAFEPACSIGVLSAALAERCDAVCACDISPTAVQLARQRCAGLPNVRIERADLAERLPEGSFDLIVFSELGYYFTASLLERIARVLLERLSPGAEFVAVHWRGRSEDHVLHGDEVHAILEQTLRKRCRRRKTECYREFRLDAWRCP